MSTVLFATGYMHEKCHTSNTKNNWKKYSVLNFNMRLQEKLYPLCIKKNGWKLTASIILGSEKLKAPLSHQEKDLGAHCHHFYSA